jgi:hypothetical protein
MTKKPENPERDDIKTSVVAATGLGVLFTLGALGTHGGKAAMSVALGAAIAVANLLTMRAIVRALVRAPEGEKGEEEAPGDDEKKDHRAAGKRGGAAWGVFALLKLFALFGGIWFLLTSGVVAPIPLVVGYGVLPLGIAAAGLWNALKPRR